VAEKYVPRHAAKFAKAMRKPKKAKTARGQKGALTRDQVRQFYNR
jgi:hypothetical protein